MSVTHPAAPAADSGECNTAFCEKDRYYLPGEIVQRRFRDPFHFLSSFITLIGYTPDIIRVYVGRAITPRLREMIMLNVAVADDCHF